MKRLNQTTSAESRTCEHVEEQTELSSWLHLIVLLIAYTLSFIDRSIVSLMIEPLKNDLLLSDTQVSLLHGFAFAIFYTCLGIPIARLADAHSRKKIIAVGIAFWSIATCMSGFASKFSHLFLARIGVGVGEAALSPAAYSMIADMFPRRLLGRALGIYSMGVFLGAGIAYLGGGKLLELIADPNSWIAALAGDTKPWQVVFFLVGAPGLIVALLVMMLREPVRKGSKTGIQQPFSEVFIFVKKEKATFFNHFIGFSLLGMVFNSFLAWLPSLMIRQLNFTVGEAGFQVGMLIMIFGTLGILAGGYYNDRHTQLGKKDAPIRAGLLSAWWMLVICVLMPLVTIVWMKLFLIAMFFFWGAFPYAAAAAGIQLAAPTHLRAQVSALYLFCLNLLGIGFGATFVALITDLIFADDMALPYSMAITALICIPASIFFLSRCLAPFRASIDSRSPKPT